MGSGYTEQAAKKEAENGNEPDWAGIRAEYVNSKISLSKLAEKYGVPLSSIQKHSASGKWGAERKKKQKDKADKVADRLHERDVKQTVKDIERCCKAAGKLIDKINKAINQVDKQIYISEENKVVTTSEKEENGKEIFEQNVKRKLKTRRYEGLVDTKKISEIAKSLLNVKQVLTGEDGSADDVEQNGLIEIVAMGEIDERKEKSSVESAADAGSDDEQERG